MLITAEALGGRQYRHRLYQGWGIVDIEDIENGVRHVIDEGFVAPDRIAIRGGSAGGYSVMACLANSKLFSAGASYYGISDLEMLAQETHKFEAHYLDSLIGPLPEAKNRILSGHLSIKSKISLRLFCCSKAWKIKLFLHLKLS